MLIGITGRAGSGKSTVADILVRAHGFVSVSLSDPIKRACAEWFDWDEDTLWGPSEKRNAPDKRYPHAFAGSRSEPREWLTPRYALQRLGTEFGRACYENVWVDIAICTAKQLLESGSDSRYGYDRMYGMTKGNYYGRGGVVISDCRFHNEVAAIRAAGGVVWKTQHGTGLEGAAGQHESERHIDDLKVDAVVPRSSLEEMPAIIANMLRGVSK